LQHCRLQPGIHLQHTTALAAYLYPAGSRSLLRDRFLDSLFHWRLTRSLNVTCNQRHRQETALVPLILRELAAPGVNLLRKNIMSPRYVRNRQAAGRNLFKNGKLLINRPKTPPFPARQNLNPTHRSPSLRN
jgi:hypothetical protein